MESAVGSAGPARWPSRPETENELPGILRAHAQLMDRFSGYLRTDAADLDALGRFRPEILLPSEALVARMGKVPRFGDERDALLDAMTAMLQTQHQAYLLAVKSRTLPPRPLLDALEAKVRQAQFYGMRVTQWTGRMTRGAGPVPLSEIEKEFYTLAEGKVSALTCRIRIEEWLPMPDAGRWDFLAHVPWEVRISQKNGCSVRPMRVPGVKPGDFPDDLVDGVSNLLLSECQAWRGAMFAPAWAGLAETRQELSAVDGWYALTAKPGAPPGLSLRLREDLRRLEVTGLPNLERLVYEFGERAGFLVPVLRDEGSTRFADLEYTLRDGALVPERSTFRAQGRPLSVSFLSDGCSLAL